MQFRRVAQLVEHRSPKPGVAGSSPASPALDSIPLVRMIKKIQQFSSDVKFEMSKVSWPDWNDLKGSTYVVLILSLILTFYLFIVDLILSKSISVVM